MSTPRSIDNLRAQRIHSLVSQRRRQDPRAVEDYARLAADLPHLLRHNGLDGTLRYLDLLGRARDKLGARWLYEDWMSDTGLEHGLHLAQLKPPPGHAQPSDGLPVDFGSQSFTYLLASSLAIGEADWFKRFAQSILGADAPAGPTHEE